MRSALAAGTASPSAEDTADRARAAQHKNGRIQDAAGCFEGEPIVIKLSLWRAAINDVADRYDARAGGLCRSRDIVKLQHFLNRDRRLNVNARRNSVSARHLRLLRRGGSNWLERKYQRGEGDDGEYRSASQGSAIRLPEKAPPAAYVELWNGPLRFVGDALENSILKGRVGLAGGEACQNLFGLMERFVLVAAAATRSEMAANVELLRAG